MIPIKERNTLQKQLILDTVRAMPNHPSAENVYQKVLLSCPGISRATVYRDLNRLADKGEILRVPVANAPDRYDFTITPHAHCLCTVCGQVFDYPLPAIRLLRAAEADGFQAERCTVMVSGVCRACAEKA